MYAFRRCASRFLTSRPASSISSSRTYSSLVAPSHRLAFSKPAFQSQRRWATTESEKEGENAIQSETAEISEQTSSASDTAPAVAESANLTEATDEALPAAETNESILAESASSGASQEFTPQEPAASDHAEQPIHFGADGFQKRPTIYVGNLFFDVTESDLVKEFSRFGTIEKAKLIRDSRGLSKGFGYIDFATVDTAEDAIRNMNMQLYEGRRMTVQFAARPAQTDGRESNTRPMKLNPPSKTLFIGNMSFEMTDRDLSNLFRGIRNVLDVRVAIDRRTGQPRGFAHADFMDVKSAMEAMKVLQEKETYGRKLRVDYSFSSASAPRNQANMPQDGHEGGQMGHSS